MEPQTKTCQNCKTDFTIEPEDFAFYEKIKVPPPTWCPECRSQRRMMWRNERSLYKRECGLTGKSVISDFSKESGVTVYDNAQWFSDAWEPLDYGVPYDFSKPFFAQFGELIKRVPMPATFAGNSVGSDYCNHVGEAKDCYLTFGSWDTEDVLYSNKMVAMKNTLDSLASNHCQFVYQIIQSRQIHNSVFVQNSSNCDHSAFLYDCRGCSSCFGCVGLRNKKYYIFNQPYTKEEYEQKIKELDSQSNTEREKILIQFVNLKRRFPHKFAHFTSVQNSSGDNLSHVTNSQYCFDLTNDVRDCKFCVNGGMGLLDIYDGYGVGIGSLTYESVDAGLKASHLLFSVVVWEGHNIAYGYHCRNGKNIFGCIGLRNKQYCILNKQYTK
ncbi:MAG: hypothetical protein AAB756_02450 [Patescibacteria group bacterium]